MASFAFFLFTILIITTASINNINAVEFEVINNAKSNPGGIRFEKEIGVFDSLVTLQVSTNIIWNIFQEYNAKYRKNVEKITLSIEDFEGIAILTNNNEIKLSAQYIENFLGDVKKEIKGVIIHMNANIWQWNGNGFAPKGLLEGIADFVRLKAGFVPRNWVKLGGGIRWNEGYDVTARFLSYCKEIKYGFVAELNKKMREGYYSDYYFEELLGKSVYQLWNDYKAKYASPIGERDQMAFTPASEPRGLATQKRGRENFISDEKA